jgi:3-oxoacyl-[acyl-carrier protein] reductase
MSKSRHLALVSGSTKGIGKAIAEQLVLDGFIVIQNSRSSLLQGELIGQTHIQADVSNLNECRELIRTIVEDHGGLDLLVCTVGSGQPLHKSVSSSDSWDHFVRINLNSTTYLVESALPSLLETKGNVVAISSICAKDPSINAPIEYTTSKAALEMFIKSMAFRYAKKGVRFNVVSPGNVFFEGSVWDQKMKTDVEAVTSYINQNVPMGKFIEPQEIARAVSFLAGTAGSSITGVVLPIDGGQSL